MQYGEFAPHTPFSWVEYGYALVIENGHMSVKFINRPAAANAVMASVIQTNGEENVRITPRPA